jgi:DNA-binding response OmpR family regulator
MDGAPQVGTGSALTATVVLVGIAEQDQNLFRDLFERSMGPLGSGCVWSIQARAGVDATLTALHQQRTQVVLCDCDLMPGLWKELLEHFACLCEPPFLIVTSLQADEHLWAEALNLGAYDVLARPFNRAEVMRTVNLARLRWQSHFNSCPRAVVRSAA